MAGDNFQKYENQLVRAEASGARAFSADLTDGVDHHRLRVRVSGTVDITDPGGGAAGAVVEGGAARLLNWRVEQDGFDFVRAGTNGWDLTILGRRLHPRSIELQGLANGNVQAGTAISAMYEIPFTWDYLANPFDLFLPAMPVRQQRRVYGEWNRSATNAGSDAGSGVLVSGGTFEVAVSNLVVEVVEVFTAPSFHPDGSRVLPIFIPTLGVNSTQQFAAANAQLPYRLDTSARVLAHMFMYRDADSLQDGINGITLEGGQVTQNRSVSFAMMRDAERQRFPGIPLTEVGVLMVPYVDNGRLGTALYPSQMGSRPRYLIDVDAPVTPPGIVDIMEWELVTRQGYTRGV